MDCWRQCKPGQVFVLISDHAVNSSGQATLSCARCDKANLCFQHLQTLVYRHAGSTCKSEILPDATLLVAFVYLKIFRVFLARAISY